MKRFRLLLMLLAVSFFIVAYNPKENTVINDNNVSTINDIKFEDYSQAIIIMDEHVLNDILSSDNFYVSTAPRV